MDEVRQNVLLYISAYEKFKNSERNQNSGCPWRMGVEMICRRKSGKFG
jgi:hypothetical protein